MNQLACEPLVVRATGGRGGGGTVLTLRGRRLLAGYRRIEAEHRRFLAHLAEDAGHLADDYRLLRRMMMRTSARNQFVGTVSGLREGEVSFEVRVRLDDANEVVAVITRASAENLELGIGREVHAFVKAPSVLIITDRDTRTTARNHLWGEVTAIHEGPVSSEVTITLPSGRNITSVVTHDSIGNLDLHVGSMACAVFQATWFQGLSRLVGSRSSRMACRHSSAMSSSPFQKRRPSR